MGNILNDLIHGTGPFIMGAAVLNSGVRLLENLLPLEYTMQGKLQKEQQAFQEKMQANMEKFQLYMQEKKWILIGRWLCFKYVP